MSIPFTPPCSTQPPLGTTSPLTRDYGVKRLVPFLELPTVGAGILAFAFFFFIAFLSNPLLVNITPGTLGIVVTLSTLGIIALILFILILL